MQKYTDHVRGGGDVDLISAVHPSSGFRTHPSPELSGVSPLKVLLALNLGIRQAFNGRQ